ncbi:MAG: SGNH/GDSL hydrolase family protein [Chloroflexota bacterium]
MEKLRHALIVTMRVTVVTLVVSFCSVELLMRSFVSTSDDGLKTYRGMPIRPLVIPMSLVEPDLEAYLANEDEAVLRYDAQLGWTFPNNFSNDTVTTNSIGLRSFTEYDETMPDDVFRIAMYGDSFMAGGEVADTDTIPYLLEQDLRACGASVEVMNFAVFGYGMDQAYLRWQMLGQAYDADLVIMGFQPENLNRNVNLLRPLAGGAGIPFSKPRYILDESGELTLVNSPTIPLEELLDFYRDFDNQDLAQYEWHYNERYENHWSTTSILYSVIEARQNLQTTNNAPLNPDDERVLIGQAIVDAFASDIAETEQGFAILHLPNRDVLQRYIDTGMFSYQFILDDFDDAYSVIHAESVFPSMDDNDWAPNFHYSPDANQRITSFTADWLLENIDGIDCDE